MGGHNFSPHGATTMYNLIKIRTPAYIGSEVDHICNKVSFIYHIYASVWGLLESIFNMCLLYSKR